MTFQQTINLIRTFQVVINPCIIYCTCIVSHNRDLLQVLWLFLHVCEVGSVATNLSLLCALFSFFFALRQRSCLSLIKAAGAVELSRQQNENCLFSTACIIRAWCLCVPADRAPRLWSGYPLMRAAVQGAKIKAVSLEQINLSKSLLVCLVIRLCPNTTRVFLFFKC